MTEQTTLSDRGRELAQGPDLLKTYGNVLSDVYHPDNNPGGYVNMGISENVGKSWEKSTI